MNSEDSRNLILAIVLSVLVLIGWNYFYGAPQLQKDRQAQTPGQQPSPRRRRRRSPARRAAERRAAGRGASRRAREALAAASKRIPIDTQSLGGSINLTGGLIDDLTLKAYRETIDPNSPNIVLFSPQGGPEPYWAETGFVADAGSERQDAGPRHRLDQRFRRR